MGAVRCALTFLPIKEPGISRYCESCNREFLNEAFCHGEHHDKANSRTGSAAEDNQESLNEYVVVNTVPETMDVDETGDENMMGGELDTLEDTGFADTLFAAFDVCPYCQSKYIG